MAKKVTNKQAGTAKGSASTKAGARRSSKSSAGAGSRSSRAKRKPRPESGMSASEALVGLLESPLVADILAAGAAAALGAIAQRGFSRRDKAASTKAALKGAAKAAAAAMAARIADEVDEIMRSSREATREEG